MNLYEAIFLRKSVRRYKWDKLQEKQLNQIKAFVQFISIWEPGIKTSVEIIENTSGTSYLKGLWKVKAPYYLVFFSEEKNGYFRNAGYILEQVVLYMAVKGLGSCYLGGSHAVVPDREGMSQVMVVAFGCPGEPLYREAPKARRLPLKDLCVFKEEVGESVKNMLRAARLAPSSMNSQPWRFMVYQDKIRFFACKELLPGMVFSKLREFDIGIMLAHIIIAAEEFWLKTEYEFEEKYKRKHYKFGEYQGTIIFTS